MTTTVVNIRKEPYDVYIGRAGKGKDGYFGNPVTMDVEEDRPLVLEWYKRYFYSRLKADPEFKRRVLELKDKKLGCFCKPKSCHGDIIAEYLNRR